MNGCHVKPEQFFNLIFGYNDRYVEEKTGTVGGDGTLALNFTAVPTGEAWGLGGISIRQETRTAGYGEFRVNLGGTIVSPKGREALTLWLYVCWSGQLVMKAGDYVSLHISGATSGDGIRAHAWGYKMKVAQ